MKQQFKAYNFRDERLQTIQRAEEIIRIYQEQGLTLTLRQLYYQFVTRNWITNQERSYKNLGEAISAGRLSGMLDWDAIEDRVRVPRRPSEWDSIEDIVNSALFSYRLPRWKTQKAYVELWVEKDALAGVLQPIAEEYHITLMVNRGYSSQSAMYDAARRFKRFPNKRNLLFYLGDHDPSGEDMVRDIRDRLQMFTANVEVTKLALTMDQVDEYNPPPNPAKMTDSRAASYVAEHGAESWEVDALPPDVLARIIRQALDVVVDSVAMDAVKAQEELDKLELTKAVEKIMKKRK